ncbi:L,D-transpeptidase family protein [Bradyrhizobium sp. INPA01-394B]|uniref:L,D-transpeptidase family protein n=1 Tax=Bradyrhizobium campsiandrae TaxID=1729892 RepID=A0ABR7U1M1_9BRAD|nr:L,D-transpeptidase [Bradyrhizobium campsiandrae]MBC9876156.1 L,D-transpeptidase family protein [Bradyrhizobium campsiandrae]MBC9977904.1 L,D-transpeptidase family protein [Bradyrhizobium campsiandrae]
MNSVNGSRFAAAPTRLWQVAILTAAGAIGTVSQAEAAFYYWSDYSDGSYGRQERRFDEPRQKPQKRGAAKTKTETVVEKETGAKPQGPLVIVVSIDRQKVTVYDSNGVFAESPVSTGMKGHSTPMGVFSVIQKHKFHHSNIYSGAPMPYMQRITWSGVAMHAGVLPGYPASHGCIRMPMAFAVKMWNWTKMGARVIVAPGQMTPQSFSHPMLTSLRVPPQPAAGLEPTTSVGDKADKGAPETKVAETKPVETKSLERKTASADGVLELRSTVGHTVMSDATTDNAPAHEEARTETKAAEPSEPAKQPDTAAKTADAPEAKPAEVAETPKATSDDKVEAAKSEPSDAPKAEAPKTDAAVEPAKSEPVKADTAATSSAPAQAASPDAKKDQTRVADPAPSVKPDLPKRTGQIAVFISRKDSKLYVRQNFAPLFDVPVTIAASERPLGTHVFTAEVDKTDTNALHWSVVSLPVNVRAAAREDDGHIARRQRNAAVIPVAAKPVITPDSPAEALDRITIPADAMAKINEMLTSGGSVIVSDQGINQGETGEGTDFIVRLY